MTLNETQVAEFNAAAKPLMDFLKTHCHPHCKVIVDSEHAEVMEGLACAARPAYESAYKVGQKVFVPGVVLSALIPDPPETARGQVVFVGEKDGRFTVEIMLSPSISVDVWEVEMLEAIGIVVAEAKIGFTDEFGQGKRIEP